MRTFTQALALVLAVSTIAIAGDVTPEEGKTTSLDGLCGNGVSCRGSQFGGCCSKDGFCGSTSDYCGKGCQIEFGYCEDSRGKPSPDGTCGGTMGYTCEGSNCCSIWGWCGTGHGFCSAEKCQPGFGKCDKEDKNSPEAWAKQYLPRDEPPKTPKRVAAPFGIKSTATAHVAEATNLVTPKVIERNAPSTYDDHLRDFKKASEDKCPSGVPAPEIKEQVFFREEIDENCVPCEGQEGSLPYCGADHTVDNYKFTPKTCRTVYYNLDITNQTLAPDGFPRITLGINGQVPGPRLEANWGDRVIVTVNNKLQDNGTSIHFHGIRQLNNSEHDGVPAITQCPIAPGDSFTYNWTATNYGTSWYHSHYAIQAWEGVAGPMVIHGPKSNEEYDEDVGTIMLSDWGHHTVDALYDQKQDAHGDPLVLDNGLINGMNTFGVDGALNQTGKRFELDCKLEPGKTYLFRIINSAIQSTFKFYIDEHELEIINMDFTNIVPYKTNVLNIGIGQRYMFLVKAKETPGNFWMRADNQEACSANKQSLDIKGIVRYVDSDPTARPTSSPYTYKGECIDESLSNLVPTAKLNAYNSDTTIHKDVKAVVRDNLFKWQLGGTDFYSRWEDPTLTRIIADDEAPTHSGDLCLTLPEMGKWVYIIVQSAVPLNHPIHLHGHDFLILGTGPGNYTDQPLNLINPPRRDTANMPAAGYLVIAFETDNPGAWLMHCHIGWHTSMGFALQIVEGQSMIKDTVKDECALYGTCANWNAWVEARAHKQHDSGV